MNKRISLTDQAHLIIQEHLKLSDNAIDATVGNGHDTIFLANQVGNHGHVFGFDIQQEAITSSLNKIKTHNTHNNTQLFHASHSEMKQYLPKEYHGKITTIMFNLGYLPGSDKSVITQADSTLLALNISIELLAPSGIITIAAYPGHSGGKQETDQIQHWCKQLSAEQYSIQQINSSDKITAPKLFIIQSI